MNRHHGDRMSSEEHEIGSKQQRIVRRKIHRSPSPPMSRSSHREVRTSSANDVYPKLSHSSTSTSQRSQKYNMSFRPSSGDLRDEHLGRSKERGYGGREHDEIDHGSDSRGSRRKGRPSDLGMGMGVTAPPVPSYYEKFEYSLHVANISQRLTDGEAKINLFRDFKRFGFVNIKVIGFGKERHAFINFTRVDEARAALNEMHHSSFFGQSLEVTWSRATLNQHPDIIHGSHGDRRPMGGVSKGHTFHSGGGGVGSSPLDFYHQGGRSSYHRDSPPQQSSSRDISYLNISPEPPPHASSRNHSIHSSKDLPSKGGSLPITDPNATRTLFVGNLEADITERELRDLFSPYGRIESVDIKVQRAISTAYAFVKFFTITDAMNAKKDMHGRKYGNVKLKIGFGKGSPSAKVWIGNLSGYADLSEIRSELDRFGLIRRIDYNNGDNHAFVHFDSLDAAQTAVNSLTTYRFRNTNRPLKIDVSQPVRHSPGSDYEDFEEPDYHNSVLPLGSGNSRRVHSHMSPEPNSRSPITRRGRGGVEMPGSDDYPRHLSHTDDNMDLVMSSVKGSYRSNRGRRVVTEVRDAPPHMRHASHDDLTYSQRDPGNFRKRGRSPGFGDDFDSMSDYGRGGGFGARRRSLRGFATNGSQRMSGSSNNGDLDFRAKRPRNGFDAYQYHKLHGSRTTFEHAGPGGLPHGGFERDRSDDRDRDHRGERNRDRVGEGGGRSSSLRRDHRGRLNESDRDDRHMRKNSAGSSSAEAKNDIEKISPPPPPPPPMTDMMSYEAADPALKLNDSTGPASSSDGQGQTGLKPDFKVESLADLSRVYPVIWRGNLVLKNTGFPTRMHLIGGDPAVAELLVRSKEPGEETGALRITQRLRLEPPRLEEVNKRMASAGHCILLALPGAIPSLDEDGQAANSATQLRPLKSLVSYLEQKEAAGIVALNTIEGVGSAGGGGSQLKEAIIGVLHAFPPCEFSQGQLRKIAPNLGTEPAKEDHVVVLLVKGTV